MSCAEGEPQHEIQQQDQRLGDRFDIGSHVSWDCDVHLVTETRKGSAGPGVWWILAKVIAQHPAPTHHVGGAGLFGQCQGLRST